MCSAPWARALAAAQRIVGYVRRKEYHDDGCVVLCRCMLRQLVANTSGPWRAAARRSTGYPLLVVLTNTHSPLRSVQAARCTPQFSIASARMHAVGVATSLSSLQRGPGLRQNHVTHRTVACEECGRRGPRTLSGISGDSEPLYSVMTQSNLVQESVRTPELGA
jgi:hypothetical protein